MFLYCLLIWAGYGNIGGGGGYQQGEDHSDIFTTQSLSFLFDSAACSHFPTDTARLQLVIKTVS